MGQVDRNEVRGHFQVFISRPHKLFIIQAELPDSSTQDEDDEDEDGDNVAVHDVAMEAEFLAAFEMLSKLRLTFS